jgi:hypothetical protein
LLAITFFLAYALSITMVFIFHSIALFCAIFVAAAVSAEPKAQFLLEDGDALLKLDYATYRGYYNDKNEVVLFTYCFTSNQLTNF